MIQVPPVDKLVEKTGSRYALCIVVAKRARQLVDGSEPLIDNIKIDKPVSIAVNELYQGKIKIIENENQ